MAVKTYSRKTDGNKQLTANFQVKEFACKDGSDKILIDTALVDILQKIRDWAKAPVHINSAYRTATHNKEVKGGSNSRHLYGEAADFKVEGKTPAEVAKYAESIGILGIGCYSGSAGSFVHVDTRTVKYFWTNNGSGDKAVATHGGTVKPPAPKPVNPYKQPTTNQKKNSKGDGVKWIQWALNRCGHGLVVDGAFGAKTDTAVKAFQKAKGLTVDGIVGAKTRAKLAEV